MFPCYSIITLEYFQMPKTTIAIVGHDIGIFIPLRYLYTINPCNMCMAIQKLGGALILLQYPSNYGSFVNSLNPSCPYPRVLYHCAWLWLNDAVVEKEKKNWVI